MYQNIKINIFKAQGEGEGMKIFFLYLLFLIKILPYLNSQIILPQFFNFNCLNLKEKYRQLLYDNRILKQQPQILFISRDHSLLAYSVDTEIIIVWNTKKHNIYRTLPKRKGELIQEIVFSQDKKFLVVLYESDFFEVWNCSLGSLVYSAMTTYTIKKIHLLSKYPILIIEFFFQNTIEAVNYATNECMYLIMGKTVGGNISCCTLSFDERYLATWDSSIQITTKNFLIVRDLLTGKEHCSFQSNSKITSAAFSNDSLNVAFGNAFGEIWIYNLKTRLYFARQQFDNHVVKLLYAADDKILYCDKDCSYCKTHGFVIQEPGAFLPIRKQQMISFFS